MSVLRKKLKLTLTSSQKNDQTKLEFFGHCLTCKTKNSVLKKSKFTEQQIAFAIKQSASGVKVSEVCRKMGISEATFFNWKKKYGGLGISELRRLRQLEEKNHQLKKLVADLSLDKQMLQDVLRKKL